MLCKHRKVEWSATGEPFRDSLPALEPDVEWHERPFRRGLGWRVKVRSLHTWKRIAPRLYETAPVGELDLNPPSVRDDWIAFAQSDTTRHLRVVHLDGMSPVEPIRALCASPFTTGITDIHFHRASSPGLPELIEDLLKTPLGHGLKGLHFHVGYESLEYLIDALASAEVTRLERLSFTTMGLTPPPARSLVPIAAHERTAGTRDAERPARPRERPRLYELVRPLAQDAPFASPSGFATGLARSRSPGDVPAGEVPPGTRSEPQRPDQRLPSPLRLAGRGSDSRPARVYVDEREPDAPHALGGLAEPCRPRFALFSSGKASARHLLVAPIPPDLTVLKLKLKYSVRQPVLGELANRFGERLIVSK